jgi:broad specificity phosphatase PhoE
VPLIYLVRHAEPAALWGAHPDPGLSDLGQSQALAVAGQLVSLRGCDLLTSPLARCRETAVPSQAIRGRVATINTAVAEIPVPSHITDHRTWLTTVMGGKWSDDHVDASLRDWRAGVGAALLACEQDTIIFSHFVAINVAVGLAMGRDEVTVFKPGHASVTILEAEANVLKVVELGQESAIHLA